jgi:putative ABC transport system substrate-binding protein
MKRRDLIKIAFGSAATAALWTPAGHAQQRPRVPRVGVLWHAGSQEEEGAYFSEFIQGFKNLGYNEGQTVIFEHRYAAEQYERFPAQVAELIDLKVDAIIASIRPAALAAQRATQSIPIIFVIVADPVESKLVSSLARPGANITGLSNMSVELGAKRLELIKEAIAGLSRIALFVNSNDPAMFNRFIEENRTAAEVLKLELVPISVRVPDDLDGAFTKATERKVGAVVPVIDSMMFNERVRLARLAIAHRLPTMAFNVDMVDAGALMAFGPNHALLFRQSAKFVDKILKGDKPGEIPVEQPTRFELRLNLKTASAIGVNFSPSLLARADKVIE